ncbi:MAG: hypothetical protein ACFHX7_17285 [Pseudomonadota bacterium]
MSYSQVESLRFRKRVHRYDLAKLDPDTVKTIRVDAPDIAIIRLPAERLREFNENQDFGVMPILADTLIEYECPLEKLNPAPLRNATFDFVPIRDVPTPEREALVSKIFVDYTNHYMSNPLLHPDDVLAGYQEWGMSFDMGWVLYDRKRPVAFANCSVKHGAFDGTLFGVIEEYAGRGIYGDLVSYTQARAIEMGHDMMTISTQVQNLAVQKAWVRRGFSIARAVNTFHVNCLLSDEWVLESVSNAADVSTPAALVRQFVELALQLPAVGSVHQVQARWFQETVGKQAVMLRANLKDLDVTGRGIVTAKAINEAGELLAVAQFVTTG